MTIRNYNLVGFFYLLNLFNAKILNLCLILHQQLDGSRFLQQLHLEHLKILNMVPEMMLWTKLLCTQTYQDLLFSLCSLWHSNDIRCPFVRSRTRGHKSQGLDHRGLEYENAIFSIDQLVRRCESSFSDAQSIKLQLSLQSR